MTAKLPVACIYQDLVLLLVVKAPAAGMACAAASQSNHSEQYLRLQRRKWCSSRHNEESIIRSTAWLGLPTAEAWYHRCWIICPGELKPCTHIVTVG